MKCPECGNYIEQNFNYCPMCGIKIDKIEMFRQVVDESFDQLEKVVEEDTMLRLENLSSKLNCMEEELEIFLTSAGAIK